MADIINQSEKLCKKKKISCDINDPLGQNHSLASREHYIHFVLSCFARFWKVGTDGRMDMCENNDPYRPWLWVGRVDQKISRVTGRR